LLATKSGQSATVSESIEYVVNQTLERLDPLRRAARATERAERQKNKSHTNRTVKLKSEEIDSIEVRKKAKSAGEYSQQSSAEHDTDVSAVCDSGWDEDINTNTGAGTRNFASRQSCVPGRTGFINTQRARLNADVVHEISLRDKSQCTHVNSDGSRCRNRRWLHFHHIKEVENGGTNGIENLTTICSGHHRMLHA
jgi:HNH endonuclease